MNKIIKNIPQYLLWEDGIYTYISNKRGILLYKQEDNDPYDNYSSSKIIVVEHRKDKPLSDAFYVLFCESSSSISSNIHNFDLRNINRLAKPYAKH